MLQQKSPTQLLGGGNSDEFYFKEGTYNKSKMLEVIHTDVSDVKWKYNSSNEKMKYQKIWRESVGPIWKK